jgi:sulfite reductase (ferredoxin)
LLKKLSKIKNWADAIYLAYAGFVNGAKAILFENEKQTTTQESSICLIPFCRKQ